MHNKNKLKQLAKNNCANYMSDRYGISNYCCSVDGTCVFFDQANVLPSCRYFEQGVLPVDQKLEHEYRHDRNMEVDPLVAKPKVNCKTCGHTFEANSNRQQYCEKCRIRNKKEKTKLRVRKLRQI